LGTLASFIILSFIIIFVLNLIFKLTKKKFSLDARILKELRTPIRLGVFLIGIYIANHYLQPDFRVDGINLILLYKIAATVLVIYAMTKVVRCFFVWYVEKIKIKGKNVIDDTIFQFLSRAIVITLWIVAILIALDMIGIEIKPILAGLGIAGLAAALALQDTLSNFFSAIYIAADQPVKIGDFIEVSSGEKGYVSDIGWRTTRLRTRDNNIVIIPNAKLAQSVITNFNQIQNRFKVEIPIGVSYKSDLEKVEKVTIDIAKKIMNKFEPKITDFNPYIRYENFGDFSISFKVSMMTEDVERKYQIVHEFIKELTKAYKKSNIEIPYPQREIHIKR
jgi:small-conductance mechanosensitive channel